MYQWWMFDFIFQSPPITNFWIKNGRMTSNYVKKAFISFKKMSVIAFETNYFPVICNKKACVSELSTKGIYTYITFIIRHFPRNVGRKS